MQGEMCPFHPFNDDLVLSVHGDNASTQLELALYTSLKGVHATHSMGGVGLHWQLFKDQPRAIRQGSDAVVVQPISY